MRHGRFILGLLIIILTCQMMAGERWPAEKVIRFNLGLSEGAGEALPEIMQSYGLSTNGMAAILRKIIDDEIRTNNNPRLKPGLRYYRAGNTVRALGRFGNANDVELLKRLMTFPRGSYGNIAVAAAGGLASLPIPVDDILAFQNHVFDNPTPYDYTVPFALIGGLTITRMAIHPEDKEKIGASLFERTSVSDQFAASVDRNLCQLCPSYQTSTQRLARIKGYSLTRLPNCDKKYFVQKAREIEQIPLQKRTSFVLKPGSAMCPSPSATMEPARQ